MILDWSSKLQLTCPSFPLYSFHSSVTDKSRIGVGEKDVWSQGYLPRMDTAVSYNILWAKPVVDPMLGESPA